MKSVATVGNGRLPVDTEIPENAGIEQLHLLRRVSQGVLAMLQELRAALVRRDGLLQGKLPGFHRMHDLFQLGERRLEALGLLGLARSRHPARRIDKRRTYRIRLSGVKPNLAGAEEEPGAPQRHISVDAMHV